LEALQFAEKLDLEFAFGWHSGSLCFWVAQRFTAAITGLFSVSALAAEGNCGAHKEFFSKLLRRGGEDESCRNCQ
jgi:hypothetical protein